jgi:peptide subunit release factor 1 (eRF1)
MTTKDLSELEGYEVEGGKVLSVYLDIDQSNAAKLNRGFEAAFHTKVQQIAKTFDEEYEQRQFAACAEDVGELLRGYDPKAHSLVIFARSTGPVWFRELNVPVETEVRWTRRPFLQPIVEALDEFETYAVVVADRSHSRVFTVNLGMLEKEAEIHAFGVVRHLKTSGTDHLYSQSHNQRKADEHLLSHFRRVVEVVEHVAKFKPFTRLILGGSSEAMSEIFRLLPKSLRRRVVGPTVISGNASEKEILEATIAIERRAERAQEMKKAETLVTSAAKGSKAMINLSHTLDALNKKRVRELIYSQGFAAAGGVCEACGIIFSGDGVICELCNSPLRLADDLVEVAVGTALAEGATVEQLKGEAAAMLRSVGGIGAFLR